MEQEKKGYTFGLILDEINGWEDGDYYQSLIYSGIEDFARKSGINLICVVTGRIGSPFDWERSRNILMKLISKRIIDGLIVIPSTIGIYSTPREVKEILDSFEGIPIVTIGEQLDNYPSVIVDNYSGMKELIDHLIEVHGRKKPAFIKGVKGIKEAESRYKAYIDSLKEHNIPFNEELVLQGNYLYDTGVEAMRILLHERIDFDAVIASNDVMAIGALTEYYRIMGTAPEKISITGFDCMDISKYHGLTTIKQHFYEQARTASETLLKVIRGEKVPSSISIPTELKIRSSCGCVPTSVKKAFVDTNILKKETFTESFVGITENLVTEFGELNRSYGFNKNDTVLKELIELELDIANAFYDEFKLNIEGRFLAAWNRIVFWMKISNLNTSILLKLLSAFRKEIVPYLESRGDIIKFENMLQAVRMQFGDTINKLEVGLNDGVNHRQEELNRLGEDFLTNLDIKRQVEILRKKLPEFDIQTCFIALYENPENPLESSRLIMAYDDKTTYDDIGMSISYPTIEVLPPKVMERLQADRFSVFIEPLHYGENQFGYAVFGCTRKANKYLEIIRYRLSVALNSALMFQNIESHAMDLERQVFERTRELSETNQQLLKEVEKRKIAEEKIKAMLKELEIYNKQLHYKSVRDELTGLYNRRGFMELGEKHYEYAKKQGRCFLVIFADMDGLKQINDKYGHAEGDYSLTKIGDIMTKSFSSGDIMARLGGDEFTVIVKDTSCIDETDIRNRINSYVDIFNSITDKPYRLGISLGFALFSPDTPHNFEELLSMADKSLYADKQLRKSLSHN